MLLDMAKVCCTDCCLYQLLDITQTYKVIYKSKSLFFKYMTSKAKGQGVNLSVKADLASGWCQNSQDVCIWQVMDHVQLS